MGTPKAYLIGSFCPIPSCTTFGSNDCNWMLPAVIDQSLTGLWMNLDPQRCVEAVQLSDISEFMSVNCSPYKPSGECLGYGEIHVELLAILLQTLILQQVPITLHH